MNRNLNSHYMSMPTITHGRSVVTDKPRHMTTANASYIVPFHWQECIPGGTYDFSTALNLRATPAVHATMDISYCDVYYFAVPIRILYDDFKHFIGEPEEFWTPTQQYEIPQIEIPAGGWSAGSVADHFGLPTLVSNVYDHDGSNSVSALPFRAYAMIYNEYFRDSQTTAPAYCPTDGSRRVGRVIGATSDGFAPNEYAVRGGELLKASKPHDLFTSAMPSPQRGPDTPLFLGGVAPVTTSASGIAYNFDNFEDSGLAWGTYANGSIQQLTGNYNVVTANDRSEGFATSYLGATVSSPTATELQPMNLVAHLGDATATTVNELRQAIAIQHIYEALALSGNRYREMLYHIWGVADTNPMRDIPQYLGGNRVSINQQSIVQNSSSVQNSPQGNVAGYTHVTNRNHSFTWSCLEWSILVGVFVIRQPKTYQQGINKLWFHRNRFDFYWPQLANIGSVGIENREIYFGNYTSGDDQDKNTEIFGYNEPWYEYRYQPDICSGAFRSNYPGGTLDSWHYADYYDECPILSDTFMQDNSDVNIDRTLAVSSELADQFLVDITIARKQTTQIPVYSIPGLERI